MKKYKYPLIYPRIYRSDKQEGIKVIESGQITMSKITKDFEKRFASYIGQNMQSWLILDLLQIY